MNLFSKGYLNPITVVSSLLYLSVVFMFTPLGIYIINTILSSIMLLLLVIAVLVLILYNKIKTINNTHVVEYVSVFSNEDLKYINFIILYHHLITRSLPLAGMLLIKCSMFVNLYNLLLVCIALLLLLLIVSSEYFTKNCLIYIKIYLL